MGYTLLNAAARPSSAVSPEADAIQRSAFSVVQSSEKSMALFGAKSHVISEILRLQAECTDSDWDGNEEEAILPLVAASAATFIRALPDGFPLPEVSPEPDGCISLDWIATRHRLFTLSIGTGNRLAYAWIDGTDRGHAVANFDGISIPMRIQQGIINIVGVKDASFRAC